MEAGTGIFHEGELHRTKSDRFQPQFRNFQNLPVQDIWRQIWSVVKSAKHKDALLHGEVSVERLQGMFIDPCLMVFRFDPAACESRPVLPIWMAKIQKWAAGKGRRFLSVVSFARLGASARGFC